jgi:phosphatidylglycerophosphatase A
LAALLLYLVLPAMSPFVYAVFLLSGFLLGVWICGKTARDIGVDDHGGIVWDEFIGFWLTMFLAPPGLFWLLCGFVLFRVFDIVKPWPIRWFDRHVHGGFGIMIDDVLAGVMAWICLQLMAVWIL